MVSKEKLSRFSIKELQSFRDIVSKAKTKEELLTVIDKLIQTKETSLTHGMNAQFSVDWFNIDRENIQILHNNGIENLAQLRNIQPEDLWYLQGMTRAGFSQISWAREFFDMTPIEKIRPSKRDNMTVAKILVKQANECNIKK